MERDLADKFIEQIKEGGVGAWSSGWTNLGGNAMPHNPTGRPYSGVNTVILWINGWSYKSNTWGTYHAWKKVAQKHAISQGEFTIESNKDGSTWKRTTKYYGVQKGESATQVILYKRITYKGTKENEDGDDESYTGYNLMTKVFDVFNRDQTGLPEEHTDVELEDAADFTDVEEELEFCLEYYIDNPNRSLIREGDMVPTPHKNAGQKHEGDVMWVMKSPKAILLKHGGDRAFYTSTKDRIALPLRDQFKENARYLSTKGHECVHSTGHPLRLNRALGNSFGGKEYAKEELIAEFGTAMLLGAFGIQGELRNVEYINSWVEVLNKEPAFLLEAAKKAQHASNYIIDPWQDHIIKRDAALDALGERLKGKTLVIDQMCYESIMFEREEERVKAMEEKGLAFPAISYIDEEEEE